MLQLATAANETVLKMDAAKAWKSKSWAASEQFVCRDPLHMKKKSVSDLLLARQSLLCYCSIVAASNRTRRSGRLSMTRSLGLGSGCTGWGWRKSQVTNPSFPSAGAVLETALAQICHEGFSMTVANADICPADQSQDMWALVQTESSTSFAHLPRTETWWQQVWQEKTLRPLLDGLTSIKHKVTHVYMRNMLPQWSLISEEKRLLRTESLSEKSEENTQHLLSQPLQNTAWAAGFRNSARWKQTKIRLNSSFYSSTVGPLAGVEMTTLHEMSALEKTAPMVASRTE